MKSDSTEGIFDIAQAASISKYAGGIGPTTSAPATATASAPTGEAIVPAFDDTAR
jgi:hypothetical protein